MTVCEVAIGFLSSGRDPVRENRIFDGKSAVCDATVCQCGVPPNRERDSWWLGLLTHDSDAAKKVRFLAEANLAEAASTSSSAPRRTRRARVMSGVCDYCSSAEALVCCRADSARLCLSCDARVRPCPMATGRPARFSAAPRWVRHSARDDRRARDLRALAGRERAAVAFSRHFPLVLPRLPLEGDARGCARRVFRPARRVVNSRRGAQLFPR